jgi:hypothetical protein
MSFNRGFVENPQVESFPRTSFPVPLITLIQRALTEADTGTTTHSITSDSDVLLSIKEEITRKNPNLEDFDPLLAVLVIWNIKVSIACGEETDMHIIYNTGCDMVRSFTSR